MKKLFLTFLFAIVATLAAMAQQISVVSTTGATTLYRTLPEAIKGADPGSVIYLPGGGFSIADSVKITKKLTIIGIGHYVKSGNVDGVTTISGNLFFNEGSSGSAVMGCYITGNINIGEAGVSVNDVLIRYCNMNSVQVQSNKCTGIIINQNYVRNASDFGSTTYTEITNNIMKGCKYVYGGIIKNNIFPNGYADAYSGSLGYIYNTVVTKNIITQMWIAKYSSDMHFGNNSFYDNLVSASYGDAAVLREEGENWVDIFTNWNGGAISPMSDFHIKEGSKYSSYGIYAGTGFSDNQLAPVPYIVAKDVKEQTDASGKLNVKIRVKAGQ